MTREGETVCLSPEGVINTVLPVSDARVVLNDIITIPYWSIVLPLTLLSAYLLFSKHPKVKPTEPAASGP